MTEKTIDVENLLSQIEAAKQQLQAEIADLRRQIKTKEEQLAKLNIAAKPKGSRGRKPGSKNKPKETE